MKKTTFYFWLIILVIQSLKRFIFINKTFNYVDYWVGGYQSVYSIDELTDPEQRRYEWLINNGQWIELKDM